MTSVHEAMLLIQMIFFSRGQDDCDVLRGKCRFVCSSAGRDK